MSIRQLVVLGCIECPFLYVSTGWCRHPVALSNDARGWAAYDHTAQPPTAPEWCPLREESVRVDLNAEARADAELPTSDDATKNHANQKAGM